MAGLSPTLFFKVCNDIFGMRCKECESVWASVFVFTAVLILFTWMAFWEMILSQEDILKQKKVN